MADESPGLTPRLQSILDRAADFQRDRDNDVVGVEHVMIAILEDPRALPTQVLARFVDPLRVRDAVLDLVDSPEYQTTEAPGPPL